MARPLARAGLDGDLDAILGQAFHHLRHERDASLVARGFLGH